MKIVFYNRGQGALKCIKYIHLSKCVSESRQKNASAVNWHVLLIISI